MNIEAINSVNFWNNIHRKYDRDTIKVDNWLDAFIHIIDNCDSPILDLGCGSGNDTLYMINKGKKVYAFSSIMRISNSNCNDEEKILSQERIFSIKLL